MLELRPHQIEAINAWKQKRNGTIEAATGIGKTLIGIKIMEEYKRVLIVVPQLVLFDSWRDEIYKFQINLKVAIEYMCYASISKKSNYHIYDLIIFDEIHHLGTDTHIDFMEYFKNRCNLGLTATMPSSMNAYTMVKRNYIDKICPIIFQLPIEKAQELGIVADFNVSIIKTEIDKINKDVVSGNKQTKFYQTEYEAYNYLSNKIQELGFKNRELGDKTIERMIKVLINKRLHVIYNLKEKANVAKFILNNKLMKDKRTIVFGANINKCNYICDYTFHSKTDNEDFNKFQKKEINQLAVVNCINEGVNIIDLDRIIISQINSQERSLIQRIGRVIRLRDNHEGKVIILITKDTQEERWLESSIRNINRDRIRFYEAVKISPDNYKFV